MFSRSATRASSSPLSWPDRLVAAGVLFLLVFTPLAYGTVEPWAEAIAGLAILLMAALWLLAPTSPRPSSSWSRWSWRCSWRAAVTVSGGLMPREAGADRLRQWNTRESGPVGMIAWLILLMGGAPLVAGSRGGVVALIGGLLVMVGLGAVRLLTDTGALGLLLVLALGGALGLALLRRYREAQDRWARALALGGLVALVGTAVQGIGNYNLPLMSSFVYLALALALHPGADRGRRAPGEPAL